MRIIAGKHKGKVLNEFKLDTTRPTSDLVKQALFNIISYKIEDSVFLDLFGGTGACGLEAISRGSKLVYCVDNNSLSINLIKSNASLIKSTNFNIFKMDYLQALEYFKQNNISFDIIFLDPPYKTDFAEKSINYILKNNLLKDNGLLCWEHDKDKLLVKEKLGFCKTKKYGIKFLSYEYKDTLINKNAN